MNSVDAQNETVESRSTPNDEPKGMMDMGNADPAMGATSSSQGSTGNALADPVYIRIYNNSGIYLETIYYKNIGFISRHEVNKEFANFLEGCIR